MNLQSLLGYAHGSPFSSSPYLDIQTPKGTITMENTPIDLLGIDNLGNAKLMKARSKNPYKFAGTMVREIPMQQGGTQLPPMIPDRNPGTVTLYMPKDTIKTIPLKDKRKINPATGKPFDKVGTKSTTVKEGDIKRLTAHAKALGVDPYTVLAMALQESNLNPGRDNDFGSVDEMDQSKIPRSLPDEEINVFALPSAFKDKMEYANTLVRQGKLPNTEAHRIQVYNGLGKLFPGTEDWNGRNRAFYGIPVTDKNPLDLRRNPAYGKTIISLRDSVLRQNPDIIKAVEQAEAAKYKGGGLTSSKAKEMLRDGKANGKKLTKKQKGYFGWVAGGKKQMGGNPYSQKELFDFIFDDEEEETANVKGHAPKAPTVEEVDVQTAMNDLDAQRRLLSSQENDALAMDAYMSDTPSQRMTSVNPYNGDIISSGQYGAQNVGNFGRQIYGQLAMDLGYAPTANSIYRSREQQDQLIASGAPAAKNSWHLTGNAIDLKPADWHRLSDEQQQFYRSNYDVVVHNNHYHIEPK